MKALFRYVHIFQVIACFTAVLLTPFVDFAWYLPVVAIALYYYFHMVGNHVGNHKYWTHQAFEAGPAAEWFMLMASWLGMQGHPALWGSGHMNHHDPDKVDTDADPIYRARKSGNPFKAIWHNYTAHYLKDGLDQSFTRRVLKNPRARFTFKYAPLSILYPLVLGGVGLEYLVWFWAIPCTVSIFVCGLGVIHGHNGKSGYETYALDDSRNVNGVFWKLLYCGGELENNHHKFPERSSFAVSNGEWDMSDPIVSLLRCD